MTDWPECLVLRAGLPTIKEEPDETDPLVSKTEPYCDGTSCLEGSSFDAVEIKEDPPTEVDAVVGSSAAGSPLSISPAGDNEVHGADRSCRGSEGNARVASYDALDETKYCEPLPFYVKKYRRSREASVCYSCDLCAYKGLSAGALKVHRMRHTGERPYSCTMCGYKCTQGSSLKVHMRTRHTGERPYSCKSCDYKAVSASSLRVHSRTHTGERPYSCTLCGYACAKSGNLRLHMMTHTGERPFSCTICDYRCTQANNLTAHMRTHIAKSPLSCDVCGKKFSRACHLTAHAKTHDA